MHWLRHPIETVTRRLGGRDRAKVVVTFAAVLGLDGADKGSIGAMAGPLPHAFHVGTTDFGLLLTASLVVAAGDVSVCLARRPTVRIRLLSWTIGGWAGAMVLAALSPSYGFLLWSRMALGAVSACAGPAIASRVGDEFRSAERGSIYSRILTGAPLSRSLIGTGTP